MSRNAILFASILLGATPAFAASDHGSHHAPAAQKSGAADALDDGEIRKVDKKAGKVTIKHGPLTALDMPAMTMAFRVKDSAMLDTMKAGDRIRFKAADVGGNLTVTEYQPAK